jgi:hypothetical protein
MRISQPGSRTGARATALCVLVCLLLQQMAAPIHVLTDEHCRVIDPPASHAPGAACRHADAHRAHHHDHLAAAGDRAGHAHHGLGDGDPARHRDSAGHGGSARPTVASHRDLGSDCPAGHCPHPVSEHLTDWIAVAQRVKAQIVASLDAVTTPAGVAMPDRVECVASRPVPPPPRGFSVTLASPRAPPRI